MNDEAVEYAKDKARMFSRLPSIDLETFEAALALAYGDGYLAGFDHAGGIALGKRQAS